VLSKPSLRALSLARQVAMALSKGIGPTHSLPEIGDAFGGRGPTQRLHATRKIAELREMDADIAKITKNLLRTLTILMF